MPRRLVIVAAVATFAALLPGPAGGQEPAPRSSGESVSPSGSPSPGVRRGDRVRSPRFVLLLVVLGLGLLWQVQRARRTTDRISGRSLEDLDQATRPDPPPPRE